MTVKPTTLVGPSPPNAGARVRGPERASDFSTTAASVLSKVNRNTCFLSTREKYGTGLIWVLDLVVSVAVLSSGLLPILCATGILIIGDARAGLATGPGDGGGERATVAVLRLIKFER